MIPAPSDKALVPQDFDSNRIYLAVNVKVHFHISQIARKEIFVMVQFKINNYKIARDSQIKVVLRPENL